jgi:endonuclease V-like protein UPF0215 family
VKTFIKKEVRAIGFDDGVFNSNSKSIVGVIFRGNICFEGLIKFDVKHDLSITEEILKILKASPHFKQLRIIMLSKNVLAGEKVDLQKIYEETKLPIIVVCRRKILKIEENFFVIKINKRKVYVKAIGLNQALTKEVLKNFSLKKTGFPEPLRVAFLIAKALNTLKRNHEKV